MKTIAQNLIDAFSNVNGCFAGDPDSAWDEITSSYILFIGFSAITFFAKHLAIFCNGLSTFRPWINMIALHF